MRPAQDLHGYVDQDKQGYEGKQSQQVGPGERGAATGLDE